MALDLTVTYSGQVDATATSTYPYGKARNITTPGDGTGTPWDEDIINDWLGFFQRLLVEAGVTPSGTADTVLASDYFDALDSLIGAATIPSATTSTEGKTRYADSPETITGTETDASVTPAGLQAKAASGPQTIAGVAANLFVTPAGLHAKTATTDRIGLVELAIDSEVQTGTDTERAVTPAGLRACTATSSRPGVVELATDSETITGTDPGRAVTPAGLTAKFERADENTVVGEGALVALAAGGQNNTAFGAGALTLTTTGDLNTATGWRAGRLVAAGANSNCFYGAQAGSQSISGSNNSVFGYYGGYSIGSYTNCGCFGNNADVTGSNQIQLGNSSTTTYVYGTVQNRSDERDKEDIEDTDLGLEFIDSLRPVKFKWDYREDYVTKSAESAIDLEGVKKDGSKKRSRPHYGLIAQEVKTVLDSLGVDWGGYQDHAINGGRDVKSIGYSELIAPMIKAIQELSAKIKKLETKLDV